MKVIKILGLAVLTLMLSNACDDSDSVLSGVEGGLVEVNNPSVNYVVGEPGPYTASFQIYQGTVKTTKVEITKTFHTTVTIQNPDESITIEDVQSNTVTMATINVEDLTEDSFKSVSFTFNDLITGLTIDEASLPTSDGDYLIGDYWELKYVSTTDDGSQVQQNKTTKITVATRFAGTYRFIEGVYYRLGVLTSSGDYWEDEYLIESIDAKTYKLNGVSAWTDQILYFQIQDDGSITYPAEWNGVKQTINSGDLITCEANLADMSNVHCSSSNYVVKDDVNKKDRLIMSFGYKTDGPREFYQVFEKIVE